MACDTLHNWVSIEVVEMPEDGPLAGTARLRPEALGGPLLARLAPPAPLLAEPEATNRVCLLSLFDGVGAARLALDDILGAAGMPGALVASWSAKLMAYLQDPVCAASERRGDSPAHTALAQDVWDLFRGDDMPLRTVARTAPRGALLVIVAGSPRQQLTSFGGTSGRVGLCGQDSHLLRAPW